VIHQNIDVCNDNAQTHVKTSEEGSREIARSDAQIPEKNTKSKRYNTVIQNVDDVESENDSASEDEKNIRNKRENRQKPRRFNDFVF